MPQDPVSSCCSPATKPVSSTFSTWEQHKQVYAPARALRQAQLDLIELGGLLGEGRSATAVPARSHTDTVLTAVPQYDRTHVQGCVCKPAIAGGACCPSHVGNLGLQQFTSAQHAASATPPGTLHLNLLSASSSALGALGVYSGVQVLRGVRDAERNLKAVRRDVQAAGQILAIERQALSRRQKLAFCGQHAAQKHLASLQHLLDIDASLAEQRFHRWIPGRLQIAASLGVLANTFAHIMGTTLGWPSCQGALVGAGVNGLFAAYGIAMGLKNLHMWLGKRAIHASDKTPLGVGSTYEEARADFVRQRSRQLLHTGCAWLGVSAASVLGGAVSLGVVVLPHAGAVVGALTLVFGAYAMWSNSCSRYAPHLPVSAHIERSFLVQSARRQQLYMHLQQQQQAIEQANARMAVALGSTDILRMQVERATAPQCGQDAFMVLPRAVAAAQQRRARNIAADVNVNHEDLDRVQLAAVSCYLQVERALQQQRLGQQREALMLRAEELQAIVLPRCGGEQKKRLQAILQPTLDEDAVSQSVEALRQDSGRAIDAAAALAVMDDLLLQCERLQAGTGPLTAPLDQALTQQQQAWLKMRFCVLQLCGILRDGLSGKFVETHGHALKTYPRPFMLPIGHIYPLPEALAALVEDARGDMDTLFVHAFFNPRRIEAEMDCLLAMEDHAAQDEDGAAPFEAEGAAVATCCSI